MEQTTCSHRFIYIETVINDRQITWWESDVHSEYRLDVDSVVIYEIAIMSVLFYTASAYPQEIMDLVTVRGVCMH